MEWKRGKLCYWIIIREMKEEEERKKKERNSLRFTISSTKRCLAGGLRSLSVAEMAYDRGRVRL
jgi:hypothetical protein